MHGQFYTEEHYQQDSSARTSPGKKII